VERKSVWCEQEVWVDGNGSSVESLTSTLTCRKLEG
jgi:hypothetical protein